MKLDRREFLRLAGMSALAGSLVNIGHMGDAAMTNVRVGDAYVRTRTDGRRWAVGTRAVEVALENRDGALRLVSLKNKTLSPYAEYALPGVPFGQPDDRWAVVSSAASQVPAGGRPAVQLDLSLENGLLRAHYHVLAYPGTSVLRLWVELESVSGEPVGPSHIPFSLRLIDAAPLTQYWMIGGNSAEDQGMMKSASIGAPYHQEIAGWSTCAFMPWMAFQRSSPSGDGWFLALEYLVNWRMVVERGASGPVTVSSAIPDLAAVRIKPGERIALPTVTIGAFSGDLDDMAARVYDWQYEYLWNYTNMDFYARPKWAVPWTFCAQNLQEQFGERLAYLDMDADLARAVGFEMLWDDAGWSAFPGWPDDNYHTVFDSTYEGPDFSQTLRYLRKSGMNWLAWFTKRPPSGVMDTKVGSWGNFEWRSDAVELPDWASDGDLRNKVRHFLDSHPRCSFHTCSLGSSYSHTFEIQRYADTNYFADGGRGPQTNYYFSYVEPPDKWTDIIEPWSTKGKYDPDKARQVLTMVPFWGLHATPEDQEAIRRDLEIYRYLLQEGVAGRWSYTCHPEVTGDREFYYSQRTSRDRTKACIILKHMAPGPVTIFPRGLLSEHRYVVGLDSTCETMIRTGADLMAHGIAIREQAPGELIYLGLPRRPRSGMDTTTPTAPGRVLARRETNLGHSGAAIYWSPGSDDTWVSYYEVRRGEAILGKVSTGTYFFDHSPGWDPSARYAVRTVDGDGNASEWSGATAIAHEPTTYHALGGLFSEQGREGWRAETTADSHTYTPMAWIRPPKTSSADEGGTPNQPGGIEGLWGGPGGAHIGRAWQQASSEVACVRTWVAPKAGTVRIVSRVMKEWYRQDKGQPLRVRILHGGRQIWPKSGWATVPLCDLAGLQHDLTADVAAGDAIRFVLDTGADPDNDIIAWMPRIIYTDAEPATEQLSVVRILCGSKQAYTDHAGNVWSADRFFSGGRPTATDAAIVETLPTLQDQPLYQHGRQGREFSYAISVSPGIYTVRLKLAEPKYQWLSSRPMDLEINGQQVLRDFDICQDARGRRRADDRVFRYVVPDAAGNIVLRFTGGWDPLQRTDQALAQAIEVLPEIRPTVRINCGSDTDFIDWNSDIWRADTATDGTVLRSAAPLTQASPTLYDQALYQAARSGRRLIYSIPLPRGLYAVHLKFAELWLTELGQRPMNIEINGRRFWESWDPATTAGQVGMAADTRAEGITPDADGRITIRITATGARNAIVQGIEIE